MRTRGRVFSTAQDRRNDTVQDPQQMSHKGMGWSGTEHRTTRVCEYRRSKYLPYPIYHACNKLKKFGSVWNTTQRGNGYPSPLLQEALFKAKLTDDSVPKHLDIPSNCTMEKRYLSVRSYSKELHQLTTHSAK